MKRIGLLGGMSWQSSLLYYRLINELVQERLGGHHSAKLTLQSLNFHELISIRTKTERQRVLSLLIDETQRLESAGVDLLLICSNTIHHFAEQIDNATSIPLLHIADVVGAAIQKQDLRKIGLLGTRYTMKQGFYRQKLSTFGIQTLLPKGDDLAIIHNIILDELVHGKIEEDSRQIYLQIIEKMRLRGAEAIVLGCTEIPLLISQKDLEIPLFDTMELHVKAAVSFALSD